MRLVIDGHRLTATRTGVGRCLESLLLDWAETGWPTPQTVLVLREPGGLARAPSSPGLATLVVGGGWPGVIWEAFGLRSVLRSDDLLFAPANLAPLNWRGKTVLIVYDTLPWSVPESFPWHVRWRFGWRYRWSARRASKVIVPSEATARNVARIHSIDPAKIEVIYPGIEPAFRFISQADIRMDAARAVVGIGLSPFFLFVGKRSRRRNVDAILEAFLLHRTRFPDHRLVFVGPDGPEGLPGRDSGIISAGHVDETTLAGLYAGARALLYPSDYEGFGLPVVEAMAGGCPVITLRNSALAESGGEAAYYLSQPSTGELRHAIEAFATDESLHSRHRSAGLIQAAKFDRARFAHAVKKVIQGAIDGG